MVRTPLIPGMGNYFRKEIFPQRSGLAEVQRMVDREAYAPEVVSYTDRSLADQFSRAVREPKPEVKPYYQEYDPAAGYRAVFGNAPSNIRSSLTPLSEMRDRGVPAYEPTSLPLKVNVPVESVSRFETPKEEFREGFMRLGGLTKQALGSEYGSMRPKNRDELALMAQIRSNRDVSNPVTLSDGSVGYLGGSGKGGVAVLPKQMSNPDRLESFFQNDFPALLPDNYVPGKSGISKGGDPYVSWKRGMSEGGGIGKPSNTLGIGEELTPELQAAYGGKGVVDASQSRYDTALYQRPSVEVERGLQPYKEPIFPVLGWSNVGRPEDARANYLQGTRSGWRSGLKSGQLGPEMEEKLINVQRNEMLRQKPLSQLKPDAPSFYPVRNQELGRNFMNPEVQSLDSYMGEYFDDLLAPGVRDTRSVPTFALENRYLSGNQIANLPDAKVVEGVNPAYGQVLRGELDPSGGVYQSRATNLANPLSTVQGDRPTLLNTSQMTNWDKFRQELGESPNYMQALEMSPTTEMDYRLIGNVPQQAVSQTLANKAGRRSPRPTIINEVDAVQSPIFGQVKPFEMQRFGEEGRMTERLALPQDTEFYREVPVEVPGQKAYWDLTQQENAYTEGTPGISYKRQPNIASANRSRYGYDQIESQPASPLRQNVIKAVGQEPLYEQPKVAIDFDENGRPVMTDPATGQLIMPNVGNDANTEVILHQVAAEKDKSRLRLEKARDEYLEPVEPILGTTLSDVYEEGLRARARRLLEKKGLQHLAINP